MPVPPHCAQVADLALSHEVERRTAAEKQLETTKQLLSKSENEWLAFRAQASARLWRQDQTRTVARTRSTTSLRAWC